MREICTPGSAWGGAFKKPCRLGEGTDVKASATVRLRTGYRFKARLYHPLYEGLISGRATLHQIAIYRPARAQLWHDASRISSTSKSTLISYLTEDLSRSAVNMKLTLSPFLWHVKHYQDWPSCRLSGEILDRHFHSLGLMRPNVAPLRCPNKTRWSGRRPSRGREIFRL